MRQAGQACERGMRERQASEADASVAASVGDCASFPSRFQIVPISCPGAPAPPLVNIKTDRLIFLDFQRSWPKSYVERIFHRGHGSSQATFKSVELFRQLPRYTCIICQHYTSLQGFDPTLLLFQRAVQLSHTVYPSSFSIFRGNVLIKYITTKYIA